jgi:hypothetical protein
VVHRHLLLETEALQPSLVVAPQVGTAAADDRMFTQLLDAGRGAAALGVIAAAVKRPVIDADAAADEAGGLLTRATPQSDVGLT